jgi:hypothetical protein
MKVQSTKIIHSYAPSNTEEREPFTRNVIRKKGATCNAISATGANEGLGGGGGELKMERPFCRIFPKHLVTRFI